MSIYCQIYAQSRKSTAIYRFHVKKSLRFLPEIRFFRQYFLFRCSLLIFLAIRMEICYIVHTTHQTKRRTGMKPYVLIICIVFVMAEAILVLELKAFLRKNGEKSLEDVAKKVQLRASAIFLLPVIAAASVILLHFYIEMWKIV